MNAMQCNARLMASSSYFTFLSFFFLSFLDGRTDGRREVGANTRRVRKKERKKERKNEYVTFFTLLLFRLFGADGGEEQECMYTWMYIMYRQTGDLPTCDLVGPSSSMNALKLTCVCNQNDIKRKRRSIRDVSI